MNGIVPDKLSKDQREILESKWTLFVAQDNMLPARTVTGMRIQVLIDRDEVHFGDKRWGMLRASSANLMIPDRPDALMSIPASPRLLLAADNPDGELTAAEIFKANTIAIRLSREFVVIPPH